MAGHKKKKFVVKNVATYKAKSGKAGKVWEKLNTGWTGAFFYCFLGIIVAFMVHQVSGLALGTGLPIVTVSSQSMVPTLNVGDIVIIKGTETYRTDDIIVFKGWERDPIIHRVVAVAEGNEVTKLEGWNELTDQFVAQMAYGRGKIYITKGDNNPRCDQCFNRLPVQENEVYGKAVAKIPYLGWVKILVIDWFITDPIVGIVILLVVGVTYYVYKKW